MKAKARKSVPLAYFGVRKKVLPRKGSRPIILIRDAKEKPNAGKTYLRPKIVKPSITTEIKSFADIPIKKLKEQIGEFNIDDLKVLLNDERVSAVRLAKEEIIKREG